MNKTIAKTITWRVIASTITFILSIMFTGKLMLSIGIMTTEVITKTMAYYAHEKIWERKTI